MGSSNSRYYSVSDCLEMKGKSVKQKTKEIKREVVKVTNPDYLLKEMGTMIYDFVGDLNIPGISYESLMSHLLYSGSIETYVALIDGVPHGFLSLGIMGAPYYSTASVNFIYKPGKDTELADMMYGKIADFMRRHKLLYFYYITITKKLAEYFMIKAKEQGLIVSCKGHYYSGKLKFKR